jgi:hypothetical protein
VKPAGSSLLVSTRLPIPEVGVLAVVAIEPVVAGVLAAAVEVL